MQKKKRAKQRDFYPEEENEFLETELRPALFLFSIFIASVCTASAVIITPHTPYSLTKKQFVQWQLYIQTQFLKWQVHLETIWEYSKQMIFRYDVHPLPSVNHCPCVCVCEWKRVIKDLNLTRQQNVSFVYPVTAAFLSTSLKLIGMSCLLYNDPS